MKRGVDFIGVGCVFVCHDGQGNVLMGKRSVNCRDEHGRWDFGGGSMEFGETFEETVRREVVEEYGTEPSVVRLAYIRNSLREHQGTQTHWVHVVHFARVNREEARIAEPEKMDAIGWFRFERLPEPLHSILAEDIDLIAAQFGQLVNG